jgi:hypothetical protein
MRADRVGWLYVPRSALAWTIAAVMVAFCVNVFATIDRYSHSASDTLYGVFPYWVATFLLWDWISARIARRG